MSANMVLSCFMPAPRAGRRLQKLHKRAPRYSAAPLSSFDTSALQYGYFLLPEARLLPFRDESGAVNINLVSRSLEQVASGEVEAIGGRRWGGRPDRALCWQSLHG